MQWLTRMIAERMESRSERDSAWEKRLRGVKAAAESV